MTIDQRIFSNVDETLNFVELHEEKGDLYLYRIDPKLGIQRIRGLKEYWLKALHAIGLANDKGLKLKLAEDAIKNLRSDFGSINSAKMETAISNLETLINEIKLQIKRNEDWDLDLIVGELRLFREALKDDIELKLKRLQLMIDASNQKIETLKKIDRYWVPTHILDYLYEIEDEIAMYEEERAKLEKIHMVYKSNIEKAREIDQGMVGVRDYYQKNLPNALNWGLMLTLAEMSEYGIPELLDVQSETIFEINPDYLKQVEDKYNQLRKYYLKYHTKLRSDLKGTFDNNFAELEGRLYYAQQLLKQQQEK